MITAGVVISLIGEDGVPYLDNTRFVYDPADPLAVRIEFVDIGSEVAWTFARDLLIDGCYGHSGRGDVQVWPATDDKRIMWIALTGDFDRGRVRGRTVAFRVVLPVVKRFLDRTLRVVPRGSEEIGVDGAIARMLERAE